jgi:hypothetical protein
LLIPPESNVERTDWERSLALQRGEYKVLSAEPTFNMSDDIVTSDAAFSSLSSLFIDGPDGWTDDYEDIIESEDQLVETSVASAVDAELASDRDAIIARLNRLMSQ